MGTTKRAWNKKTRFFELKRARGAARRCPRGCPMASLVQRRDKRADIDNRRQYLQLFACQRAAPLYRWWYSLAIDTKHESADTDQELIATLANREGTA